MLFPLSTVRFAAEGERKEGANPWLAHGSGMQHGYNLVKWGNTFLPTIPSPLLQANPGFISGSGKIKYLCLQEIDKENGHPTELGMKQISEQVTECLHKK